MQAGKAQKFLFIDGTEIPHLWTTARTSKNLAAFQGASLLHSPSSIRRPPPIVCIGLPQYSNFWDDFFEDIIIF